MLVMDIEGEFLGGVERRDLRVARLLWGRRTGGRRRRFRWFRWRRWRRCVGRFSWLQRLLQYAFFRFGVAAAEKSPIVDVVAASPAILVPAAFVESSTVRRSDGGSDGNRDHEHEQEGTDVHPLCLVNCIPFDFITDESVIGATTVRPRERSK